MGGGSMVPKVVLKCFETGPMVMGVPPVRNRGTPHQVVLKVGGCIGFLYQTTPHRDSALTSATLTERAVLIRYVLARLLVAWFRKILEPTAQKSEV